MFIEWVKAVIATKGQTPGTYNDPFIGGVKVKLVGVDRNV
jgi:hypothetical protein